jgi:hypothetical protein
MQLQTVEEALGPAHHSPPTLLPPTASEAVESVGGGGHNSNPASLYMERVL